MPSEDSGIVRQIVIGSNAVLTHVEGINEESLAEALEAAFDERSGEWVDLARSLAGEPTGDVSHTAACAADLSDFGLMLAWEKLAQDWAAEPEATLLVCPDPWLFRQLRQLPSVTAGPAPSIWRRAAPLWLRGWASRAKTAVRLCCYSWRMRDHRRSASRGRCVILVYGHPSSNTEGFDGYFGDLMTELPDLIRILHVDCPPHRARELAQDGRTFCLHGWGNPLRALSLVGCRWRPGRSAKRGPYGWLVRRAAMREGATAQASTIRWQSLCQRSWIQATLPRAISWPWENHAWERNLVRDAKRTGARTIGYQHSIVSKRMLNRVPACNPDADAAVPDAIFCVGNETYAFFARHKVDKNKLFVGGAFRFPAVADLKVDANAPVFMALPYEPRIAAEMVAAARHCSNQNHRFLVKDHPMSPVDFTETEYIQRTEKTLTRQTEVSAVIYAASIVGLEAVLAGVPTFRFRSITRLAADAMPAIIEVPTVEGTTMHSRLAQPQSPPATNRDSIFAPIDWPLWRAQLA